MPTAQTQIPTQRASRYLVQLCRHASQLRRHRMTRLPAHATANPQTRHQMPTQVSAEWTDTHGTIRTDAGTCTLRATPDTLTLHLDTDTEDTLNQMRELLTTNLTRFSRRDPLTITWDHPNSPPAPTADPTRHKTIALILIGVLAITAHIVLGGTILAAPQWTGWTTDAILAAILIKITIVGLGYLTRRRRAKTH